MYRLPPWCAGLWSTCARASTRACSSSRASGHPGRGLPVRGTSGPARDPRDTSLLFSERSQAARAACAAAARAGPRALFTGTDGCGVPVIGMSLHDAAWLFALLAAGATPALTRVRDAMLAHPVLVAGEGRLDTNLIRAGAGGIVAKGGAEGVQGIGLDDPGDGLLGCAVKVEDGSGRPIPVVVTTILARLGGRRGGGSSARSSSAILDQRGGGGGDRRPSSNTPPAASRGGRASRPTLTREATSDDAGPEGARESTLSLRQAAPLRQEGRGPGRVPRGREGRAPLPPRAVARRRPGIFRSRRGLDGGALALVHRWDGEVAGGAKGHFIGGLASVDELMVKEDARGQGLGSTTPRPVRGGGAEKTMLADRPAGGQGTPGGGFLPQARLSSRVRAVWI